MPPAPHALLFDLDGVLADVSGSYRAAIRAAAAAFGVDVDGAAITEAKHRGDANNDWILTWRLLAERGVHVSLEAVTARFEAAYQGTPEAPGLWTTERLLVEPAWLARLAERWPLAIVTGRPEGDAHRFLSHFGLLPMFRARVTMHEAPRKPDPAPVRLAMARLGLDEGAPAWMIGDTPDDIRAARAAGVGAIGIAAPGEDPAAAHRALWAAGADGVVETLAELVGWLEAGS